MSSYLNLLLDEEIQYRSAALDKKGLRMGILAAAGLIVLGLAWITLSYRKTTAEAEELQRRWKTLEPQAIKAKEQLEAIKIAQGRVSELRGWGASRMDLAAWLDQLAELIPENMQLKELDITGTLAGVEGEGISTSVTLPVPERRYTVVLRGLMAGQDSEQQVIAFLDTLKNAPFKGLLQGARLRDSSRVLGGGADPTRPRDPAGSLFTIELKFKPRPLAWQKES